MKKLILTVVAASLMVASTVSMAAASDRHHAPKMHRAVTTDQFRNANNAIAWPAQTQPNWVSDYTEGHVISAPAGH